MSEENTAQNLDDEIEDESVEASAEAAEDAVDTEGADIQTEAPSANEPSNDGIRPVDTPDLAGTVASAGPTADISMILDIPVTLSMEIGQTRISINELLKLSRDSVIELQRMADEPMDVLVNGTLVAKGEAVVVGDRFGIRLTDVISPQERLRKFT